MDRRRVLLALVGGGVGAVIVVPNLSVHEAGVQATIPEGVTEVDFSRDWNPSEFTEGVTVAGSGNSATVEGGMWDGNECSRKIALTFMTYEDGVLELVVASEDAQDGVCDAESKRVGYTVEIQFDELPDRIVASQRNHVGRTWETTYHF